MAIANSIYAFSFFFRLCFNVALLWDHNKIVELQCHSCMNGTAGFAMYIFSYHFFCELLPLTAIFMLQLISVIKAEKSTLRVSLLLTQNSDRNRSTISGEN